jgi:hypothetical protein
VLRLGKAVAELDQTACEVTSVCLAIDHAAAELSRLRQAEACAKASMEAGIFGALTLDMVVVRRDAPLELYPDMGRIRPVLDELDQHLLLCETFRARSEEATAAAALLAERMQAKAALALRLGSLSEQRDSAAHAALKEYFVAPPLAQRSASGPVDDAAADAVVLRHS